MWRLLKARHRRLRDRHAIRSETARWWRHRPPARASPRPPCPCAGIAPFAADGGDDASGPRVIVGGLRGLLWLADGDHRLNRDGHRLFLSRRSLVSVGGEDDAGHLRAIWWIIFCPRGEAYNAQSSAVLLAVSGGLSLDPALPGALVTDAATPRECGLCDSISRTCGRIPITARELPRSAPHQSFDDGSGAPRAQHHPETGEAQRQQRQRGRLRDRRCRRKDA